MYALGVVMWEMITGAPVFLGLRSDDIRNGVAGGTLRPEFPPWVDAKFRWETAQGQGRRIVLVQDPLAFCKPWKAPRWETAQGRGGG